jgi:3-hydroxy-9,10-secoandrosta-1,3,5(10)-triene-9,17-dione monooxygenase
MTSDVVNRREVVNQSVPTSEEMVERIRALAPRLRERAPAAEEARRLPPESVDELVAAGVPRILTPRRFGGYELGLVTLLDVVREVAKADASHGWCASLMAHHPHYIAQYSEEAQQAVWSEGPDVVIAASVVPAAQVTTVDGGYRVSSRAPFTSGIYGASWVIAGGFLPEPGPPRWAFFLIRPGEYTVDETWFTAAMRGTGSNTVVIEDVLVAEEFVLLQADLRDGRAPGGIVNSGAIYRAPWYSYAPLTFVAPMLGATLGAYEDFRDWTVARSAADGSSVADFASIQTRLGRTAATIDAADALVRRAAATAQHEPVTQDKRVRSIRDYAYAAQLLVEAIDTLMQMSGTAGYAESNAIQRAWRDVHFASSHITLNPDIAFAHWGRTELGREHPQTIVF